MRRSIDDQRLDTLPWTEPLTSWPSNILCPDRSHRTEDCRFVRRTDQTYAICSMSETAARREFRLLTSLANYGLPVSRPHSLVIDARPDQAFLALETPEDAKPLAQVLNELALLEPRRDAHRQALQEALATLLAHLHLAGYQWHDGALRDPLVRRTPSTKNRPVYTATMLRPHNGSMNPELSEADRMSDLAQASKNLQETLVREQLDQLLDAATFIKSVQSAYRSLWTRISQTRCFMEDEGFQLNTTVIDYQDLNDRAKERAAKTGGISLILRAKIIDSEQHQLLLQMLSGLQARPQASKRLLQDIYRYHSWLEFSSGKKWPRALAANRWLNEVYKPALENLPATAN